MFLINKYNSALFAGVILVFILSAFVTGTVAGAEAAHNQSVEIDDQYNELDRSSQTVKNDIKENTTGFERAAKIQIARVVTPPVKYSAKTGIIVGYEVPQTAKMLVKITPLLNITILTTSILVQFYRIREVIGSWR